jgi:hypothetical protein
MPQIQDVASCLPPLVQASGIYAFSRISATPSGLRQTLKCSSVVVIGVRLHGVGRDNNSLRCLSYMEGVLRSSHPRSDPPSVQHPTLGPESRVRPDYATDKRMAAPKTRSTIPQNSAYERATTLSRR